MRSRIPRPNEGFAAVIHAPWLAQISDAWMIRKFPNQSGREVGLTWTWRVAPTRSAARSTAGWSASRTFSSTSANASSAITSRRGGSGFSASPKRTRPTDESLPASRANQPMTSKVALNGAMPSIGMRPRVGRIPRMPQ